MTIEIAKALVIIHDFCLACGNYEKCPLNGLCGKLPSEW